MDFECGYENCTNTITICSINGDTAKALICHECIKKKKRKNNFKFPSFNSIFPAGGYRNPWVFRVKKSASTTSL